MNEVIRQVVDGEYMYRVYYDEDDNYAMLSGTNLSFDFGSDDENNEYIQQFKDEKLSSYMVEKLESCKCCASWLRMDLVGAIHAESAQDAIKIFKESENS